MELCSSLCSEAAKLFAPYGSRVSIKCVGMQNYVPERKFDLFWFQWCIGHLTDAHFISLLKTLKTHLNENGLIVIKDNFTSSGDTGSFQSQKTE